jgi:hypothetical protein
VSTSHSVAFFPCSDKFPSGVSSSWVSPAWLLSFYVLENSTICAPQFMGVSCSVNLFSHPNKTLPLDNKTIPIPGPSSSTTTTFEFLY